MSETIAFKPESLAQVHKIIARYPEGRQKSALLPVLHIAQKEFGGWLDVPVMDYVAGLLSIKPIEVYEVATFYTMFNMKPLVNMFWKFAERDLVWFAEAKNSGSYQNQTEH